MRRPAQRLVNFNSFHHPYRYARSMLASVIILPGISFEFAVTSSGSSTELIVYPTLT